MTVTWYQVAWAAIETLWVIATGLLAVCVLVVVRAAWSMGARRFRDAVSSLH